MKRRRLWTQAAASSVKPAAVAGEAVPKAIASEAVPRDEEWLANEDLEKWPANEDLEEWMGTDEAICTSLKTNIAVKPEPMGDVIVLDDD